MAREKGCELRNPLALRAEQDTWWATFRKHAINAQPDIDKAALDKAIRDFRSAQQSLTEAIGEYQDET